MGAPARQATSSVAKQHYIWNEVHTVHSDPLVKSNELPRIAVCLSLTAAVDDVVRHVRLWSTRKRRSEQLPDTFGDGLRKCLFVIECHRARTTLNEALPQVLGHIPDEFWPAHTVPCAR